MSCSVCVASPFILLYSIKESLSIFLCLYLGRGVLNKVLHGESPPRGPTLYPFIYHFLQKSIPSYRCATSILLQQENKQGNNNNNNNNNNIIIIIIMIIIIIIIIIKEKINVQMTLRSYIFVSFHQITFKPCNLTNFKALFPAHFTLILLWSSRLPATFASISLIITQQSTTIIVIVKQLHSITLPHRWLRICNNASKRSQAVWRVLFDKFLRSFNAMTYLANFFLHRYTICRYAAPFDTIIHWATKK